MAGLESGKTVRIGALFDRGAPDRRAPDLRPVELPMAGNIVQFPEVGGLHHRYLRQAA